MSEFQRLTDREYDKLARDIGRVYRQAQREIAQKMGAWNTRHAAADAQMRENLKAGKITEAQYQRWMRGQVFVGKQWDDQVREVSTILVNADREAARLINTSTSAVFIENANHCAYEIEKDLGGLVNFSLYNAQTVAGLVTREPELLPRRVVDGVRDEAWQTKQIANAVAQGIIQGDGIPEISKRIARDTGISAGSASTRYARTAMTGAQNGGRQARMEEAEQDLEEEGIEMQKRWDATLDDRTRDAHAELDGDTIPVDESFHNSIGYIKYPGDPAADDANVWNCRCSISYVYPQYQLPRQRRAYRWVEREDGTKHRESYIVGDVTYEEWKKQKEAGP